MTESPFIGADDLRLGEEATAGTVGLRETSAS